MILLPYLFGISMTTFDFYYSDIWKKTLDKIKESGQITENVMPYFSSKLVSLSDDQAEVSVPAFINYSIMNQNLPIIESCLEEVIGRRLKVRICQQDELPNFSGVKRSFENKFISSEIDPNQTFADFVVGRSNSQAHIAALTCASNLGIVYNPLFIYGNSGLGKTHLLNAVGNQVKSSFSK